MMAPRKKPASVPPAKRNPNSLEITDPKYTDPVKRGAMIASSPVIRGAVAGRKYAEPIFGADVDLTAYSGELRKQADAVKGGDMSAIEDMLVTQANTLDMIFNQLARKSAHCEYLNQMEANLRLALKAQAQCRSTLEALAEIKNPRPVAFVRQANIANGLQQVNNGVAPSTPAQEAMRPNANELLERQHDEWLDARTAGTSARSNPALETVGTLNRATN